MESSKITKKIDMFNGSIWNKNPMYALPAAATGILEQLFNASDIAVATVISNIFSSAILFVKLMQTDKWIRLDIKKLRIDKRCLLKILGIGFPAVIQSAVFNIANVVIQSAINSLETIVIAAIAAIIIILCSGRFLLSLFNRDAQVIAIGYERLVIIFIAYCFSMLYEVMSGYLRGFGISLVPAVLTIIGVCGTRIGWVYAVFPKNPTFHTLMLAYLVSLSITAVLIFIALLVYHQAHRNQSHGS